MSKLLSSNFARLWKNKVFWLGTATMFLCAAIVLLTNYRDTLAIPEYPHRLDEFFFDYAPYIGGFCAVFISLFIGTDYSDGTIRNKLIVGHSRHEIYLANLVVGIAAGLIMLAAYLVAMIAIGVPLFEWLNMNMTSVIMYLLVSVFMVTAFASIFSLIGMLGQNKAEVAVISILAFLALVFAASYFDNRLAEPELYSGGYIITKNDVIMNDLTPRPNPDYVKGNLRGIFQFIIDFLPTGQGIQILHKAADHLWQMPLYSLLITIITTLSGIFAFRRKDIK